MKSSSFLKFIFSNILDYQFVIDVFKEQIKDFNEIYYENIKTML